MARFVNRTLPLAAALCLPIWLGACAGSQGDFPSLAKRDAERMAGTAQPVSAEPPVPLPPPSVSLAGKLDGLVARASIANGEFQSRLAAARRAIEAARGSAAGGEAWTQAHMALSGLQASRNGALTALADLDSLYVEERMAQPGELTPSAKAIAEAQQSVQSIVETQDNTLEKLATRLR